VEGLVEGDVRLVALRQALTWAYLLVVAQVVDVLTTAADMARGTIESMAATAQLLDHGGLGWMLLSKVLIAVAAGAALGLAALRTRKGVSASSITFRLALTAVQAATLGVVWAALSNVGLLSSLVP